MFKKLKWSGDKTYKHTMETIDFPNCEIVFSYSVFEGLDLNWYVSITGGIKDKTIPVQSMEDGLKIAEEEHQKTLQGFFEVLESMKV